MIFTKEQFNFISEAQNVSLESAFATLEKQTESDVKSLIVNLPEGKDTNAYSAKLISMKIDTFKSELGKSLRAFAHDVVTKKGEKK